MLLHSNVITRIQIVSKVLSMDLLNTKLKFLVPLSIGHIDELISLLVFGQYQHKVNACGNRGIKHDFPFINICKVQREVLKTEGEARGFQHSRGTLRMLMKDKSRLIAITA